MGADVPSVSKRSNRADDFKLRLDPGKCQSSKKYNSLKMRAIDEKVVYWVVRTPESNQIHPEL